MACKILSVKFLQAFQLIRNEQTRPYKLFHLTLPYILISVFMIYDFVRTIQNKIGKNNFDRETYRLFTLLVAWGFNDALDQRN